MAVFKTYAMSRSALEPEGALSHGIDKQANRESVNWSHLHEYQ